MSAPASLAAYYRAHREAFLLAQELGCTPKEAERVLRRRARERRAACGRIVAEPATDDANSDQPDGPAPADFAEWTAPWMMRD